MKIEHGLRTSAGKALIAAVAVAGLVLGQQHFAHAYAPPREADREQNNCVRKARLLMTVAVARSQGMDKQTLMDASRDESYRAAINDAYSLNLEGTAEQQQAVINRFALDRLATCLQAVQK